MARPPRIQVAGTYHVTSRGTGPSAIFLDDADRQTFLATFSTVLRRSGWVCDAFCLMDTHYHLLIETPAPNIAAAMHRLNGLYARSFNRRHGRVGHLFQARYHAVLVQTDNHLLELFRYLALNPVRGGLCSSPEDWPWSSYASMLNPTRQALLPVSERPLQLFGGAAEGLARLRAFVEGNLS